MTPIVVKADPGHARRIAPVLRNEALVEVLRKGSNTEEEIRKVIKASEYCWTGLADDDIACIIGIQTSGILSDVGLVWMITTKKVEEYPFIFLRYSQVFMKEIQASGRFRQLFATVRSDFKKSLQWVRLFRFKIEPEVDGFHFVHWERP